jgi:hypothetical protein
LPVLSACPERLQAAGQLGPQGGGLAHASQGVTPVANRLAHASQGAKSAGSRIMGPLENRGEIACFARKSPQNQRQPHRLFHPSLHFSKHSSLILKRGFISQICTYFAHLFSKSPKMYDFYGSEPLQKKSKFCAVPPTRVSGIFRVGITDVRVQISVFLRQR